MNLVDELSYERWGDKPHLIRRNMKHGIGEWLMDNVVLPIGLSILGFIYWIRYLLRKVGL